MRLFEHDPYAMLTRTIDPAKPIVALDVGAHLGTTARRIVEEFPKATVYAFEPSPELFDKLVANCRDLPGVVPLQLAVGDRNGSITFNITGCDYCSSVLKPSALGKTYYGDWYDVQKTVEVEMVRLDDWAERAGVGRVDFIKMDVQGFELPALRGAERILRSGVAAINCEAQLAQEYENASTFSEIDLYVRSLGFTLHQIHELWSKGPEMQSSYLDGLWLTTKALSELRINPKRTLHSPRQKQLSQVLHACRKANARRVAVYGTGFYAEHMMPVLQDGTVEIVCYIDDTPTRWGTEFHSRPVVSLGQAANMDFDGIVLCSDKYEAQLWANCAELRHAGMQVWPISGTYPDAAVRQVVGASK